jgi:DNA-binding XRE family transcriptional regulator
MPNVGTLLRDEITRLSRRTLRGELAATKKASTQHRRQIAALKRQVALLARQVLQLARRLPSTADAPTPNSRAKPVRFVAKGLRSYRERLGLSATDFGKLVGVSAQSIYNWELGAAKPRAEQAAKLAALRRVGKREAHLRLQQLAAANPKAQRKASRRPSS